MSVFSCDICKREFTEKYSSIRHVKDQHGGLASIAVNRIIDVIIMKCLNESACLKLLESGVVDHLDTTAKRLEDNTSRVGGALNGTVNEYSLNLEDEHQDASNVLDLLKESTFQV